MALLEKHLVAVAPGETKNVRTFYAGRQEVQVPAEKKCKQWKCLHCVAIFSGDARRCARHFLPTSLPKRLELSRTLGVWTVTVYTIDSTLKPAVGLSLVLVFVPLFPQCSLSSTRTQMIVPVASKMTQAV